MSYPWQTSFTLEITLRVQVKLFRNLVQICTYRKHVADIILLTWKIFQNNQVAIAAAFIYFNAFGTVNTNGYWLAAPRLHDMTESLLATHSFHIASLSMLGRMPPLHLLLVTLVFLPGQGLARLLQIEAFHTLVCRPRGGGEVLY